MKNKLKEFPILHRFYAKLIDLSGLSDLGYSQIIDLIQEYEVLSKCACLDKSCASVYLKREEQLDEDIIEILPFDKAFVILHFEKNGLLEIEALESKDYPYVQELLEVLEYNKVIEYSGEEAQREVDDFFENISEESLNTIIID